MTRILTVARIVWIEMLRKKDLYVLFILLCALLMMLLSVNVYGLSGVSRYIKDLGLLLTWVFALIFAVATAGRQLPQEETRGTIYPLLAKPITRMELLAGKWLGAWTMTMAAALAFYAAVWLVVTVRGGVFLVGATGQAVLLHLVSLGMVTALALALSTRLTYGAAASLAYVLILASYLIVPNVPEFLVREAGFRANALLALYYALPHFELFDMRQRIVHDWGAAPWPVVGGIVLYGFLWMAALILLAWLGYRVKRFKRGERM